MPPNSTVPRRGSAGVFALPHLATLAQTVAPSIYAELALNTLTTSPLALQTNGLY